MFFGNQTAESVNHSLKSSIALQCFNLFKPKDVKEFRKLLNLPQKKLKIKLRAVNSEIREILWTSSFFVNLTNISKLELVERAVENLASFNEALPKIS